MIGTRPRPKAKEFKALVEKTKPPTLPQPLTILIEIPPLKLLKIYNPLILILNLCLLKWVLELKTGDKLKNF